MGDRQYERNWQNRDAEYRVRELKFASAVKSAPKGELSNDLDISYIFGDSGSAYRLRKLARCVREAQEAGVEVEEIAKERFPSLVSFYILQEEQSELEKHKRDSSYVIRKKPVGEYIPEKLEIPASVEESGTNWKQELKSAVKKNLDTTSGEVAGLADLINEEKFSNYQKDNLKNIIKDKKFSEGLQYLDESLEKLSNVNSKTFATLTNNEDCIYCLENTKHVNPELMLSISDNCYLLLTNPIMKLIDNGPLPIKILPVAHRRNSLEFSPAEWEETQKYMAAIAKYYYNKKYGCIFYENCNRPRSHGSISAAPIPLNLVSSIKGYFKNGIIEASGGVNSQHTVLIPTTKGLRAHIAKESNYFHVWLNLQGGYSHIIEEEERWPYDEDLFARRVIGGALGVDRFLVEKKNTKWTVVKGGIEGESFDSHLQDIFETTNNEWAEFDPLVQ